ncbi:MAG: bacillithiol biosynthesis deacetylase BshB1 [Anaerolineae bacterium]|jgi:bacillithiol biosynthesis deacetylase BshB1
MPDTDVMAFGPHPDDIELGCGGTLIKLVDAGYSVVLVDLVRGELGTRGTVEARKEEAARAADVIGAIARENLGLEDGNIHIDDAAKRVVADVIRAYRPRAVLLPYYEDRHPDHYHASELIYDATYLAGLLRYETAHLSYRPAKVIYYMGWYEFEPTFIVDITAERDRKMEAIHAYSTQFTAQDASYEETVLTSPGYHWLVEHRMAHYGALIGVRYGEGFLVRGRLRVDDPLALQFESF